MTVASTINRVSYAGNGSTTAFAFAYKFLLDADLVVVLKVDATGVETTQAFTTNYTLVGAGSDAGGTVTMLVAPASGQSLVIYRDPAVLQPLNLANNDTLPAEEVEKAHDRVVLITQRTKELSQRSVRLPEGFTSAFNPILPGLLPANTVVAVNDAGTGWIAGPTTTEIVNAEAQSIAAAASATAAATSETNAATSATNAATSETNAATSETNAATSETNAAASAANAAANSWEKITIGFAALQTAALTNTIELTSLLAKGVIEMIIVKSATAFVGASITNLNVEIGLASDADKFMGAYDALAAVGDTNRAAGQFFDGPESFASATSIKLKATAVGANLDALSAGSLEVWVKRSLLP